MAGSPPPLLHQRYRILNRLGQGRLAAVYRAQDERLQRPVLVHLLRQELLAQPTLRQRFLEEAQRGAQRSHHSLLEVYDSGEVADRPYMVTEDIAGQPLAEILPLPLAEALSILRTVASGVALAQSHGAPHPPVSSRNVWVLAGGRAVLLENWLLSPREAALDLAHYRAPERARGAPPSPATTVYALGILSWEGITGRRPFTGPTPEAIAEQQELQPLPLLTQISPCFFVPGLDRVIAGAADPDPSRRYPAPVDFGRALDLYVDQATAQTGRLAILPRPSQPKAATGPMRVFRRRGDTTAGPALRPPPPPPVLRQPPKIAPRMTPPPQPVPAYAPASPPAARRFGLPRSCQRALVKRSIQIALIIAVIYGVFVGLDYATAQIRQTDPRGWIIGQMPEMPGLPDFAWLDRLRSWRDILPGGEAASTLVVTQPVNLRPGPSAEGEPLRELPEGTVLQRIGGPVEDQDGRPLTWIEVIVVDDGQQGWVADQPGRIQQQ